MVVKLVESLVGLLKYHDETVIDSRVFRLHYAWTTSMLFLACILLTCADIIGKPIVCMGSNLKKVEPWVLNYCWITSTHTLDVVGIQAEADSDIGGMGRYDPELHQTIHHGYYQWVPFVLFGMGCSFYIPHLIWKTKEEKTVEKLLQGLDRNSILDQSPAKVDNILRYIQASKGINGHYFYYYMGMEILNFVNVVTQMCLLDKFIGGQFSHYGIKSLINLLGDESLRQDPMLRTFPRITKCMFSTYGTSGTIEKHDNMCLLPQNMINEKVFLIIWVWFLILTTITASYVTMRLVLLLAPTLNAKMTGEERLTNGESQDCEEQIELHSPRTPSAKAKALVSRTLSLGDYCLLELLQENLDYATFQAILKGLHGNYIDPYPGFLWYRPYSRETLEF